MPKKEGSKDSKSKPKLKRAANGFVMALKVPLGEVLTDMCKKKWVVGPPIGQGGFGTIYSGDIFESLFVNFAKIRKVNAPFSTFGVTLFAAQMVDFLVRAFKYHGRVLSFLFCASKVYVLCLQLVKKVPILKITPSLSK
jgi:hypothetical protein